MKKTILLSLIVTVLATSSLSGQTTDKYTKIDLLLVRGAYDKVVDTCRQILETDSLNADIWFRMGLAYQNFLPDDKSFDCFLRAASADTLNKQYKYMLARAYSGKGKNRLAAPLLEELCESDSMNWQYAFHLTSIYMQDARYDDAIGVYNRFYKKDSTNYVYLDKLGFAYLRKGEFETSKEFFRRSLIINERNTNALKNSAYLYTMTYRADTALKILTRGIGIDPSDMDLYARRAALHYSINYNKRALNDYLTILASGDSSTVYLKRAGIGYANNLQPGEALKYLTLAYKRDTTDYETMTYMAQSFLSLKDFSNSILYYNKAIEAIMPVAGRLGISYVMLAECQKTAGLYKEAIDTYLKANKFVNDPNLYMIIGNLYDEKLNNPRQAIRYYQLFLDNLKNARTNFSAEYIEAVRKRLEYLKNPPPPVK